MPSRERACGGSAVTLAPSNSMRPPVGATSPVIRLNKVVFPGAVGADDRERLAAFDGEAQRVHGLECAVGLGHVAEFQEDRHAAFTESRRAIARRPDGG